MHYMMTVLRGPSAGRAPGGRGPDARSWAARERAIIRYVCGKRG
jgi:hypothetical protein